MEDVTIRFFVVMEVIQSITLNTELISKRDFVWGLNQGQLSDLNGKIVDEYGKEFAVVKNTKDGPEGPVFKEFMII